MIQGVHTMFYTSQPEALRAFLRDKLGFPAHDVGDGWLIFDLPEADMGCHPSEDHDDHAAPAGTHDISFYCEDVDATVEELRRRGVEFAGEIRDVGFARAIRMKMPGGVEVLLYEPNYVKG
jgi:catechol 2,3-dioxygenase-like lactoylglutathione lyase family enzyme